MPELVASIDAGTTGITVLVLDGDAEVRGRAYSEFSQSYPKPGWVEHDADEIWRVTESVLRHALADAKASAADVAAIGITNQRETTVLWERATGRPVAPAIVWQCRRSAGICERLRSDGLEDELRARTGLVLDPYFSSTKIIWYLENLEGLRARAESGEIAFGTIDSWLIWQLTGGAVHVTEPSNAARTMLYSLEQQTWDPWILERLDIPDAILPELRPTSGRFGETEPGLFGGVTLPVSGVAGDQQAALFGQACFAEGMAKNTYGTGSFVLMNTGARVPHSKHGLLATAAWDLDGSTDYALEGAIFATGAAVQWMRDGLGIIERADQTEALAGSVSDSGGTYLVPAFTGLGAPHWDPYARGAYVGITRGTTKAHLARAAVEAMAYQTRDVVDAMAADSGVGLAELRVDGGASVMDLMCRFQADQLGVPVRRPANLETTALGAAYLAGLAEGVWSSREEVGSGWKAAAEFEPSASRDEADALYEGWKRAVERAGGWAQN
ncbi:MAG TPA: glycerol kinase GlpK [Actinomycetota bacterium]|nr:glycerol kinase GlpK [Actinomycetota bacterium]